MVAVALEVLVTVTVVPVLALGAEKARMRRSLTFLHTKEVFDRDDPIHSHLLVGRGGLLFVDALDGRKCLLNERIGRKWASYTPGVGRTCCQPCLDSCRCSPISKAAHSSPVDDE